MLSFTEYREKNPFATFRDYIEIVEEDLIPIEACVSRCKLTGLILGTQAHDNALWAFRSIIHAVDSAKIDVFDLPRNADDIADSLINEAIGMLMQKLILSRATCPIFKAVNRQTMLDDMPQHYGITYLASQLVFFTSPHKETPSSDAFLDAVATQDQFADDVLAYPEKAEGIYNLLLELDARYDITTLQLSKDEQESIQTFRANGIEFAEFEMFLDQMIIKRERGQVPIAHYPTRWTQKAYGGVFMRAAERETFSNVIPQKETNNKTAKQPAKKKRGRPKTKTNLFDNISWNVD